MACVVKFGSEAVVQVVNSVCQQIIDERGIQTCCYVQNVSPPLLPSAIVESKSSTERVKRAKPKKTSTTRRRGFRVSTHRK